MISLTQYLMGRDKIYASEFSQTIHENSEVIVDRVNKVLGEFSAKTGIVLTEVASGWRPSCVNCETSNAADHSRHISAQACDIRDTPNRDLARWVAANQDILVKAQLWVERFEWTAGKNTPWVHFQSVPPMSGKRFYVPSSVPAPAARLPEQDKFNC